MSLITYVAVRTAAEMQAILKANPFRKTAPNHTYVIFLDEPPPAGSLDRTVGRKDEEMQIGAREIYVHYPGGMGRSRLKIPAAASGTARNLNTVATLAALASVQPRPPVHPKPGI